MEWGVNMETILREFRNLPNEQYGELVKMVFRYIDTNEICGDSKMTVFFRYYVQKKIDYLLKQRARTKRNMEEKNNG